MSAIASQRRSVARRSRFRDLFRGNRRILGAGIERLEERALLATFSVDFDTVDASAAPVSGAALDNYLIDFGITITNATPNITPVIANENNPPQGFHVGVPSSPPNYFITDNDNNGPYSFRVNFGRPLSRFAFTRITENGGADLVVAPWTARALDSNGTTVDRLSEGEHSGFAKQSEQFALEGEAIVAVIFERTEATTAGLNAVPTDDWVLTEASDGAPIADNQSVTTAVNTARNIVLTASDPDNDPLTFSIVTFPSHGSLMGTAPNVLYTPATNFTGPDSFTFKASDGRSDSNIATVSITVTSGQPVITTNTGSTVPRGGTDVITSSELSTADSNTGPAQLVYTVTSPPVNGSLRLNTAPTTTFTQADINANRVTYVHNNSSTSSDSFAFSVSDGSSTPVPGTFNITVTGVSSGPVVTTNTGSTVVRVGSDVITASELTTTDSDTPPEQLTYTVTSGPVNGMLRLNGVVTNTFTQADINASRVVYFHSNSQSNSDSFVFKVSDGTTSVTNQTFTITVATAGAPVITTNTGSTVTRNGVDTITSNELNTTDPNNSAQELTYTVTQPPAQGTLHRFGVLTSTFTQADINAGQVTYRHSGGQAGTDSFQFSVSDGSTPVPGTFNITITGVSGTPVITTNTGSTVVRGGSDVITSSELTTTDSNTPPEQLTYTVTSGPVRGMLRRDGNLITTFTQAQINAGQIRYFHDDSQAASDSFQFSVTDGTTPVSGTFNITVTAATGAPVITTNTGSTVTRNGVDTITSNELNTTDPNNSAQELTYTVTQPPAQGTLHRFGVPTSTFTQADINAGQVTYRHSGGQAGTDSFQFSVTDGTTPVPGTFNISITGVSGAPVITTNTGSTVLEGRTDVITPSELKTTDADSSAGQLVYTVITSPVNGTLRLSGAHTTTFTQADIDANRVTYLHNASETTSDSFVFRVSDGVNTAGPATFSIAVTPVSDMVVRVDGNGKLTIETDDRDDIVTVTGVGTGTGQYVIKTKQGNEPEQTWGVAGVKGDIFVNLHGGNDQLTMNNTFVNGAIDIQMEEGNDTVTLGDQEVVSTRSELRVDLGAGNDTLDGKRLFIGTNQIIQAGDGDDTLLFEGFVSPKFTLGTSAGGFTFWSGGGGNDTVRVRFAFNVGSWGVFLGEGTDQLNVFGSAASGDVLFSGDAGDDNLTVDTNFFDATFVMNGLGGADTMLLANGLGTEFASLVGGDGNDSLTIRNQTTKHLRIEAGSGADNVNVQGSAFDRFFALLGDENDELTVRANLVQLETDLDGGGGASDRLFDRGNLFRGAFRTRGFEL